MPDRRGPLRGVLAAALTPLRRDGEELDTDAIAPLVDLYVQAGLDGVFVGGTTGESLMLSLPERKRLAEAFVAAAGGRFPVAVHAGAQTTAATLDLITHAGESGADCVAVAPPPFFAFDEPALLTHFLAAAQACAPLPFYLYEIRQRTGYSIPLSVVQELRERVPHLAGMKVSDPTLEEVERYLASGLDVMVGAESLIKDGLARGAAGAVSGLAGALPRHVVGAVAGESARHPISLGSLRAGLERFPFHAAGKLALMAQHIAIEPDVRAPLRQLTAAERTDLEDWLAGGLLTGSGAVVGAGGA